MHGRTFNSGRRRLNTDELFTCLQTPQTVVNRLQLDLFVVSVVDYELDAIVKQMMKTYYKEWLQAIVTSQKKIERGKKAQIQRMLIVEWTDKAVK